MLWLKDIMAPEMDSQDEARQELGQLMDAINATSRSVIPGSADELLQSIVGAAAQIFGAAAASIALLDEQAGELVFKVSHGEGQDEIIGKRFPINQGIAGYVAMTGQPIAVSDVREDPRFNKDFAASTGYVPDSILATPLLLEDRIIGVMSVLDKINASSFGMHDMELLGVFGQQAAIAINQSQKIEMLGQTIMQELRRVAENSEEDTTSLNALLADLETGDASDAQEIELLVTIYREMAGWGENERKTSLRILAAYADYVRSKPRFI